MRTATDPRSFAATGDAVRWEPLTVEQVAERLRELRVPWSIAGGWALDLFIGRQTRAHKDVEVAVFRDDVATARAALAGWEVFIAESGTLTEWREGVALPAEAHELWCRERGRAAWQLELLVEERVGDRWVYRRDRAIGMRAADLVRRTADGVPYIRPEVQLLYKSKATRPEDESDLLTVLPLLDIAARSWLAAALWTIDPRHRWLERLK